MKRLQQIWWACTKRCFKCGQGLVPSDYLGTDFTLGDCPSFLCPVCDAEKIEERKTYAGKVFYNGKMVNQQLFAAQRQR